MSNITLNLVVLRSPDIARAAAFYSRLGLQFSQHRHGSGPEHFAAELPGGVFELYPLSADGASTLGIRIGFRVPSVDAALAALSDYPAAVVRIASCPPLHFRPHIPIQIGGPGAEALALINGV